MSFVNEFIPDDQKESFDREVFHKPFSPFKEPIELYRWTIDRDRNIFVLSLGTVGPEQPEYFAFSVQGDVVKFAAFVHYESEDGKATVTWRISRLEIPESLSEKRDAVIKLLIEGLTAMGNSNSRSEGIDSVIVIFQGEK